MSSIINAAPKVILEGIQDLSTRVVPREPEQIPMHLPQFFTFAQKGPKKNHLLSSISELNDIYGEKTADYGSKYANHITPFIQTMFANANSVMFKRLVPADANCGNLLLSLHVISSTLPVYERHLDGTYKQDEYGDYLEVSGQTVSGYKLKWEVSSIDPSVPIGSQKVISVNDTTTIYPIIEIPASSEGEFSGNIGIRLSVPTASSTTQPDFDVMSHHKTMLLRFALLSRADELSSPTVVNTIGGEKSVDFSFKENVVDKYNIEKYYKKSIFPSYEDSTTPGMPPIYSPLGQMHFYKDNHLTIAQAIKDSEIASLTTTNDINVRPDTLDLYEVNYFTGLTPYDVPYSTIAYDLSADKDKVFTMLTERNTLYLSKGSDGSIDLDNLDALVKQTMQSGWEDPSDPLEDMAVNPFSTIWDSGFGEEAKKSLCEALGERKDVSVVLSTFEYGAKALSWAEEESYATVLKTYAAGYPESVIYGTPVCRALVVSGRGYTVDGMYKEASPLTIDLCDKVAKFMGAGNGSMNEGRGFDVSPNNQITMLRDVTGAYKSERQRQKDWDAGMVWAQNYDRKSLFYPAVQTVYPDDTSVLNSAINMFIAAELEKVCEYVWRNLSGNAKLTTGQFIERSNNMILERTANRFDDRVIIVPDTFYTAADTARGYSWSCRINMYANNMKTVGTFTIVARRRDDLAA